MSTNSTYLDTVDYPNLRSFMKRHTITIGNLAEVTGKSYPTTHQKINKKVTARGKVAKFDIDEAHAIINLIISAEQNYLKGKFGENWESEWKARWGHIADWFKYLFFDEVVSNVTGQA